MESALNDYLAAHTFRTLSDDELSVRFDCKTPPVRQALVHLISGEEFSFILKSIC